MTTITNILKGNFTLLDNESKNFSVFEGNALSMAQANQLFEWSIEYNLKNQSEKVIILIDFDLEWMRQLKKYEKKSMIEVQGKTLFRLDGSMYGIFYFNGLVENEEKYPNLMDDHALGSLDSILLQIQADNPNKPILLYLKNIQTLELFHKIYEISVFFSNLSLRHSSIKQVILKQSVFDAGPSLKEALYQISTAYIQVQEVLELTEKTKYLKLMQTLRKSTGYSFQQMQYLDYVAFKNGNQIQIFKQNDVQSDLEKIQEIQKQVDLQRELKVTFSIVQNQNQKLINANMSKELNPYLNAQINENNWDNTQVEEKKKKNLDELITLEGEDIDNEMDDDEDLDV